MKDAKIVVSQENMRNFIVKWIQKERNIGTTRTYILDY